MGFNYYRALSPMAAALGSYFFFEYFFPEQSKDFVDAAPEMVRGGDDGVRVGFIRRVLQNRSLKAAIISAFFIHTMNNLTAEIIYLAIKSSESRNGIVSKSKLAKIINGRVVREGITSVPRPLREVILDKTLTFNDKSEFIKEKLLVVLKSNTKTRNVSLALFITGLIIICSASGIAGIAIILEALRKLLVEGSISQELYEQLTEEVLNRA